MVVLRKWHEQSAVCPRNDGKPSLGECGHVTAFTHPMFSKGRNAMNIPRRSNVWLKKEALACASVFSFPARRVKRTLMCRLCRLTARFYFNEWCTWNLQFASNHWTEASCSPSFWTWLRGFWANNWRRTHRSWRVALIPCRLWTSGTRSGASTKWAAEDELFRRQREPLISPLVIILFNICLL